MIRTDKRMRLCLALLTATLCFIWGNSLLPGEVSGAISDWVGALLAKLLPGDGMPSGGTGLLRKTAHFLEFATLGALLGWLAAMLGRKQPLPLSWGILAACVDETIQIFVPDRGPALRDVLIDSCGMLAGMALLKIGYELWKKTQP